MKDMLQACKEEIAADPLALRDIIRSLHGWKRDLDDEEIDRLFGLPPLPEIDDSDGWSLERLEEQLGCKRLIYVGTSYKTIRDFIREVKPQSNDVVYDLGCGYGRVVLYGALASDAQWRGVDIVPHRIAEAQRVKEKFKIDNAQFRLGNVADQDFSDGTIFYLFDPFEQSILETVARRLEKIAKVR
ncbi:methyltransferase domain-containing protein, partial [Candidatus Microgenomates bacterium]|nr:methyltransferase domain-containing protein [Candidatus Microgenomates bacterium]